MQLPLLFRRPDYQRGSNNGSRGVRREERRRHGGVVDRGDSEQCEPACDRRPRHHDLQQHQQPLPYQRFIVRYLLPLRAGLGNLHGHRRQFCDLQRGIACRLVLRFRDRLQQWAVQRLVLSHLLQQRQRRPLSRQQRHLPAELFDKHHRRSPALYRRGRLYQPQVQLHGQAEQLWTDSDWTGV